MLAIVKAVFTFIASLLRRGAMEQNAIASATETQEGIIDGLRRDNQKLTERCDLLQENYDKLAKELAELRFAVGLQQLEGKRKDQRIAELEAKVEELQHHG